MKLKEKYTVDYLKKNGLILLEVLHGSHAHNLNTLKSDIDKMGVFILEESDYLSMQYKDEQFDTVESKDPDVVYHELNKFMSLLYKNNPTTLELLASANIPENILYKHPNVDLGQMIDINQILSKNCEKSFAEYAKSQIRKARGLNKKIVNPIPKKKKSPLDFCYFLEESKSVPLKKYLGEFGLNQLFCGLVNVPNSRDVYALYYDYRSHFCFDEQFSPEARKEQIEYFKKNEPPVGFGFKGIIKKNENDELVSNQLRLTSIPKNIKKEQDIEFKGHISYNMDGYIKYCKDYKDYWAWVENRNEDRYSDSIKQNYDTKNMCHCVRLLSIAKEIAEGKGLILRRTEDREFLLDIKGGNREYDEVIEYAQNISDNLDSLYKNSNLLDNPSYDYLNKSSSEIRKTFYGR